MTICMRSKVQPKNTSQLRILEPKPKHFQQPKKNKLKKLGKQIQDVHSTSLGAAENESRHVLH